MDRNELMEMAVEAGLVEWVSDCGNYFNWVEETGEPSSLLLKRLANAILERAAVEIEDRPARNAAYVARSLKIKDE